MDSIETIQNDILAIKHERLSVNRELKAGVNAFLDLILSMQKKLNSLSKGVFSLNESLRNSFNQLSPYDVSLLAKELNALLLGNKKLIAVVKRNPTLYSGIKTVLHTFQQENESLQETTNDLLLFRVQLPQDPVFINITQQLKAIR